MKLLRDALLGLSLLVINNQVSAQILESKHSPPGESASVGKPIKPTILPQIRATVWSDDFSNPLTWAMTNTSGPTSIDWTIENSGAGYPNAGAGLNPFLSSTAANGFAVIDSDGVAGNTDGDGAIVAEITNVTPIDLSLSPSVILTFVHSYRWWHEDRGVRVSGDNGSTWTEYPITSDAGGVFPNGYPNGQSSANPETETINISAVAGGMSQVLIQFYYNDNDFWAWYWVVDDVEIFEQPANDVEVISALLTGTTNDGVYYARTPLDHIDGVYNVGSSVTNLGSVTQTNVALTADFSSGGGNISNASTASMLSGDTTILSSVEASFLSLPVGTYSGTYTVISDQETGGVEFGNNTLLRNVEITEIWYSQDGVGVHPAADLVTSSTGTSSFVGGDDGLVLTTMYHIKQTTNVNSLRVLLASGTVPGGDIYGSFKDSANFWAGNMTPLWSATVITVSATDIANGYADLIFPGGATLTPGTYYAAVELYSNAGASPINVVNDETVTQPVLASAIYIPGDQSYTNGESYAIRLRKESCPGFSAVILDQTTSCFGQPTGTAVALASGAPGPYTYEWSNSVINDSVTGLGAGFHTVTVTAPGGCETTISVTIIANAEIVGSLSLVDETCDALNDGTAAVNISSGGVGSFTYLWNTAEITSSISGLDAGFYSVTATDADGCSLDLSGTVNAGTVDFSLAVLADVTTGDSPLDVIFENQTPSLLNYDFTWVFGDGASEQNNANFVPHTYSAIGTWNVTLVAVDTLTGCTDSLNLVDYIVSLDSNASIGSLVNDAAFVIYPNPTQGVLTIETTGTESSFEIKMYNSQGQVVLTEQFMGQQKEIEVVHLASGVYYIQLKNDTMNQIRKIVKQ